MTTSDKDNAPVMIGGGGHALSLASMAPIGLRPAGYVDIRPTSPAFKYLGDDETFLGDQGNGGREVIVTYVAPGSCSLKERRRIIEKYSSHRFATVVSDRAIVAPDAYLGAGTAVFPGAIINSGVFLGGHAVVNTGAIIEHGVTAGTNVFLGPGSVAAGGVTLGENVYIGAGVSIRNGVTIGDNITVGVGAAVVNDLTEPGVYVGVPAKLLKKW
ncbi:MAG: hypothetical protein K2K84_02720 [Muribaculaceae bacterium]|nr:hypothetical protein [Muribaculaceae bacterium]